MLNSIFKIITAYNRKYNACNFNSLRKPILLLRKPNKRYCDTKNIFINFISKFALAKFLFSTSSEECSPPLNSSFSEQQATQIASGDAEKKDTYLYAFSAVYFRAFIKSSQFFRCTQRHSKIRCNVFAKSLKFATARRKQLLTFFWTFPLPCC